ncbi:ABC transporter substrate-binding protein [Xenophilus azovorans]|uniref:ABC transporter substrate-binding protein n=1 Tax=Xenophilus azovorans TaxID=151755 RepID=UPI00056FF0C4|nr:ABC transporter substrate-binding protein [Xenophilus azovorans]
MQRRRFVASGTWSLALAGATRALAQAGATDGRKELKWGYGGKNINTATVSMAIPEPLGYYKEEGIGIEILPVGTYPVVLEGLRTGTLDFGTVAAMVTLPLLAKGQKLPIVNFMEYTYPFKWSLAVKPESSLNALEQLRGKRIGIPFFGSADFEVGKGVLALVGLTEKDVQWIATGEGIPGGLALQRGDIDALFTYDSQLAVIEGAGLKLRYLTLPSNVPKVGGQWLGAATDRLGDANYRRHAVAFGRSVAKANIFILENPEAAAYLFLMLYPEMAPMNMTLPEKVNALLLAMKKRAALYKHYDPAIRKWGYVKQEEIDEELKFAGVVGKVDGSALWTNDLVDEINRFDELKIRRQAREFELPYKR